MIMHIPFIDLKRQYHSLRHELEPLIAEVFSRGQFVGGPYVSDFESAFASKLQRKHCIGTGNGTDALFTILKSLEIGPGDEVITPAFGCMPSSEVISLAGAVPVFSEVDPRYYTLDPEKLKEKINAKTKAVIVVHLYGQSADLSGIMKICREHQLHLVEDCAQAHLTTYRSRYTGTFGVAAAFSFYPTKNLGAFGDAGCIITDDDQLAQKMRRFANHGALIKDDHLFEGFNSRLDTLQAALLHARLKYLESWNDRRRQIAAWYNDMLKGIPGVTLPAEQPVSAHTYHIYAIRTVSRDALKAFLQNHGIGTMIHYPKGLPFTDAYAHRHLTTQDFPVTASLQQEILSLPVYPELTDQEVDYIAARIREYFAH